MSGGQLSLAHDHIYEYISSLYITMDSLYFAKLPAQDKEI